MSGNTESNANTKEMLQAKITSKASAYIKSVDASKPLSKPVYAINWFNTKALWLYNLYNLLAVISVKKVGGSAVFKGRVKRVISGDDDLRRDVLLIVNYPSVNNFVNMLENAYFKLVSLLRLAAVKDYTFGFTHPLSLESVGTDRDKNRDKSKIYLLHHYQGNEQSTKNLQDIISKQNIEIYYAGRISALVYSGDSSSPKEQIPCLMQGLFLLRANKLDKLTSLIQSEEYQAAIKQTKASFIATLNRVL